MKFILEEAPKSQNFLTRPKTPVSSDGEISDRIQPNTSKLIVLNFTLRASECEFWKVSSLSHTRQVEITKWGREVEEVQGTEEIVKSDRSQLCEERGASYTVLSLLTHTAFISLLFLCLTSSISPTQLSVCKASHSRLKNWNVNTTRRYIEIEGVFRLSYFFSITWWKCWFSYLALHFVNGVTSTSLMVSSM